jgi:hypothetical protein
VELWDPQVVKGIPLMDISMPPPDEFELRVIVWSVHDVPAYDPTLNQSDLYCKATLSSDHTPFRTQKTDVHYCSKTNKGNFNWRCVWDLKLPKDMVNKVDQGAMSWPRLRLAIYDKNLFSADEAIGEKSFPLDGLLLRGLSTGHRSLYVVDGEQDFDLCDLKIATKTKEQESSLKPKMKLRMELVPKILADELKAARGRAEPNQNPFLPEPEGRIQWSLFHPLNMCYEILGEDFFKKICCWTSVLLLLTAIAYLIPMYFSDKISMWLFPN